MKEKLNDLVNKKWFHIVIMVIILAVLMFILGITILKYNVEGETNMPFNLTKISIISTAEGTDKHSDTNKWAFDISQNNDIFLYIEKNENYKKTEALKSVLIDNINVNKQKQIGQTIIYKPDATSENQIFTTKDENIVNTIEYVGDTKSNFRELKILNQGDKLAFRVANKDVCSYESNDEETINHNELLKKANLTEEDISLNLSFDITISLENGKQYKGTVTLELPVGNIIDEGTGKLEITDFSNVIFKRIKN